MKKHKVNGKMVFDSTQQDGDIGGLWLADSERDAYMIASLYNEVDKLKRTINELEQEQVQRKGGE